MELLYYICAKTATVQERWTSQYAKCTYSTLDNQQQSDPEDLFAMDFGLHLIGKDDLYEHVQWAYAKGEHSFTDVHGKEGGFWQVCYKRKS